MKSLQVITKHLKVARPTPSPTSLRDPAHQGWFRGLRSNVGGVGGMAAQSWGTHHAQRGFVDAATAATGGDLDLARGHMSDMVGGHYVDPTVNTQLRDASNQANYELSGISALAPTIFGGVRGGGPYGLFFGASPMISQALGNAQIDSSIKALDTLPENQRLNFWNRFRDQDASLQAENPEMFDRLSKIQSNFGTANKVRGGFFDQWSVPMVHDQTAKNLVAQGALRAGASAIDNGGRSATAAALRQMASSPGKSSIGQILVPSAGNLLRAGGAGVATLATNAGNNLIGGVGAPAQVNPETGKTQYDGDVPWWHHSLRGARSSIAGAVGGAPAGPVGMIGGAIANPVIEASDDLGEIAGHFKRHFGEDPIAKQNRMIETSRAAWRAQESAAKFDAAKAQNLAESKKVMEGFTNYRNAMGLAVGVPLAGLLLYKMLAKKKKKPAPEPEPLPA